MRLQYENSRFLANSKHENIILFELSDSFIFITETCNVFFLNFLKKLDFLKKINFLKDNCRQFLSENFQKVKDLANKWIMDIRNLENLLSKIGLEDLLVIEKYDF